MLRACRALYSASTMKIPISPDSGRRAIRLSSLSRSEWPLSFAALTAWISSSWDGVRPAGAASEHLVEKQKPNQLVREHVFAVEHSHAHAFL